MAITPKRIRIILRWMHIVFGLIVMCYIYSPLYQYFAFRMFVKIIVVPVITLSGIWIWKFQPINRFLKIV